MSFVSEMPETSDSGVSDTYIESEGNRDILLEKMRANIDLMSQLMADTVKDGDGSHSKKKNKNPPGKDYFIDGNVLSTVFSIVLLSIIVVSLYAFYHLFLAILKKFPSRHEEL